MLAAGAETDCCSASEWTLLLDALLVSLLVVVVVVVVVEEVIAILLRWLSETSEPVGVLLGKMICSALRWKLFIVSTINFTPETVTEWIVS